MESWAAKVWSWVARVMFVVRVVCRGRREAGREGCVVCGLARRAERRAGVERRWVRSCFLEERGLVG